MPSVEHESIKNDHDVISLLYTIVPRQYNLKGIQFFRLHVKYVDTLYIQRVVKNYRN